MTYHAGQVIACPAMRSDRRNGNALPRANEDRRSAPRFQPCKQTHGRVQPGKVAHIRVLPRDMVADVRACLVERCASCHTLLELIVDVAREAA